MSNSALRLDKNLKKKPKLKQSWEEVALQPNLQVHFLCNQVHNSHLDFKFAYTGRLVRDKKRLDVLTLDGLGCPPFPQDPELVLSSTSRDKKVL